MVQVLVSTYAGLPSTLTFSLPSTSTISELSNLLESYCPLSEQYLSSHSHAQLLPTTSLSSLTQGDDVSPLFLRLGLRLKGGKGGFASQLRAQGGRMSSNKATNNDSCRDLNGRRLSTIKEATKLADYIQAAPERVAQQKKEAQAKLEALNAEIARLDKGINSSKAGPIASGSGSTSKAVPGNAGQKRRLEDSKFVAESRELNEGVRDAVKEAMMKKRKKNKAATAPASNEPAIKVVETKAEGSGSDKEQVEPKK